MTPEPTPSVIIHGVEEGGVSEKKEAPRSRPQSKMMAEPRMVSTPSISGQEFYKLKNKMVEVEKRLDSLDFSRDTSLTQGATNVDYASIYKELDNVKGHLSRQMERLSERVETLEP